MTTPTPSKILLMTVLLFILSSAAIFASLCIGSVPLTVSSVTDVLFKFITSNNSADSYTRAIVMDLRLPRAVFSFLVGAGLSIAGIIFQVVLKNPLAEPYILGISGGSAAGAVIAIFAGFSFAYYITVFSFAGALVAIGILLFISTGRWGVSSNSLLLGGVIINAFFAAVVMFILSVSTRGEMQRAFFWLMGDLSNIPFSTVKFILPIVAGGGILTFVSARKLNVLSLGDETALQLGVNVRFYSMVIIVLASLLTAGVVASSGLIGFVGLVVPHMVRLTVGADNRITVPASFFAGGTFLLISDTIARTVISPIELPVGTVTAIIGSPFFLYLLKKESAKLV
ncbi:MAG: iron ABC transporter permease [Candidatus Schekmanbacteria bacterium]|nr:iron ABC transporter permease [Candidatus Schekmanbacteria bacterium]